LSNRRITGKVPAAYNSQEQGVVRVKICVDSDGRVVEATPTQSGSTTTSGTLRSAAQKAALQWRFAASPGSDKECGWIDFNFRLK
jgi:TonB family protein